MKIKEYFNNSLIIRILAAAAGWIDRQWGKSFLALGMEGSGTCQESGLIGRAGHAVHMALCRVFHALGLHKLTEGSVFTREYFWLGLAVFFAPILPTMAVLVLALVGLGSVVLGYARDGERRGVRTPVTKWLVAYALVYAVSGAFNLTWNGNITTTLLTLAFAFFAMAVMDTFRSFKNVRRLIDLMVLSGAVVSLYGMWQALTGVENPDVWIDERLFSNITLRVFSTLDNPNVLSEYLLLIIPLGVTSFLTAKTHRGRTAAGAATAVMGLCMFLTWSRAGWLGLFLSLAVFLALIDRRIILPGLVALGIFVILLPSDMFARLMSVGSLADSSSFYRISIWTGTLRMLRDCWIVGVGPGAFSLIYPQYSLNAAIAYHSHNLYLQILCDSGILGIVSFLGLVLSPLRAMAGALTRGVGRERRLYLIALIAGIVGFLFQGIAEYSFYNFRVMLVFFIYLGLAAALSGKDMEESR